jgi:hypothetical protein
MGIGLAPAIQRRTINGILGTGLTLKLDRPGLLVDGESGSKSNAAGHSPSRASLWIRSGSHCCTAHPTPLEGWGVRVAAQ